MPDEVAVPAAEGAGKESGQHQARLQPSAWLICQCGQQADDLSTHRQFAMHMACGMGHAFRNALPIWDESRMTHLSRRPPGSKI